MNILIADDEYYARKALVQLVQDWDASACVLEAQNGQEALELLEREQVDIMFTDIRMPMLDGLELSRRIGDGFPSVCNVIVSGYDDFGYAQEAIRYGVKQYVLKPAEKADVIELLEQMRDKLLARREQGMRIRLEQAVLGEGPFGPKELEELGEEHVKSYVAVVLQAGFKVDVERLRALSDEVFAGQPFLAHVVRNIRHADRAYILLLALRMEDVDRWWACKALFRQLRERYVAYERRGEALAIGISGVYGEPALLQEACREAEKTVLLRLVREGEAVFDGGDASAANGDDALLTGLLEPLYHKLIKLQREEAGAHIGRIFQLCAEQRRPVLSLYLLSGKLLDTINAAIERLDRQSGRPPVYLEPVELSRFFSWQELAAHYRQSAEALIDRSKLSLSRTDAADELKLHVDRHFQTNIKLEELARTVWFTDPAYLSKQFKKRFGVSFSQYLIAARLRHAHGLLQSGESLSVADVAVVSGFNDYSYFIQAYKRHYGTTPGKRKKERPDER